MSYSIDNYGNMYYKEKRYYKIDKSLQSVYDMVYDIVDKVQKVLYNEVN